MHHRHSTPCCTQPGCWNWHSYRTSLLIAAHRAAPAHLLRSATLVLLTVGPKTKLSAVLPHTGPDRNLGEKCQLPEVQDS